MCTPWQRVTYAVEWTDQQAVLDNKHPTSSDPSGQMSTEVNNMSLQKQANV